MFTSRSSNVRRTGANRDWRKVGLQEEICYLERAFLFSYSSIVCESLLMMLMITVILLSAFAQLSD